MEVLDEMKKDDRQKLEQGMDAKVLKWNVSRTRLMRAEK
jgi:hypothetical protein